MYTYCSSCELLTQRFRDGKGLWVSRPRLCQLPLTFPSSGSRTSCYMCVYIVLCILTRKYLTCVFLVCPTGELCDVAVLILLQNRPGGRGGKIYCYRMAPPLCSGGPPPRTRFALLTARGRHLSMPEIGEKERYYLFKELYKLKNNNLMSSLRSQSPLEYPQTHSPSFPPLPSLGYRTSEKEIEVRGSSLPKL